MIVMNFKDIELEIELYETRCEIIDDNFEVFEFEDSDFELLSDDLEGEYYE